MPESSVGQVRLTLLELANTTFSNMKQQVMAPDAMDYLQRLSEALATAPADGFPRIIRALLLLAASPGAATIACSLQDAGLEVVPGDAHAAIQLLRQESTPQPSDVAVLRSDWGQDWRLFADLSLLELGYPLLDPRGWADGPWSTPDLIDPARSAVHRWVAFRRAINLVKAARLDDAWEQVQKFGAPSEAMSPLEMEVVNLRAYLLLVMPADREGDRELNEAIALLEAISQSMVAERNLRLLRERGVTLPRERPRIENPYLVLGVDHRDPGWKNEWRSIQTSKAADINEKADANRAHDRILAFERGLPDTLGDLYALPLDNQFMVCSTEEGTAGYAPFQTEEDALEAAGREVIEALKLAALSELLLLTEQEQEAL